MLWSSVLTLALLLGLAGAPGGAVLAQGGETITYGSSVIGTLTEQNPFVIYAFTANAGDLISVVVTGIAPDVLPSVSLMGPNQSQVAVSRTDSRSAVSGRVARLDYRVVQGGSHSLVVNNTNNTPGEFLLSLDGRPSTEGIALTAGATESAALTAGSSTLYTFDALPNENLLLALATETQNFAFMAWVYAPNGSLVATLGGDALRAANLSLAPGSGQYEVEIVPLGEAQGTVQVALVGGGGEVAPPPVTPTFTPDVPVATPTPAVCQATSTLNVNVRSGPSTLYQAFGSLVSGTTLNVVGRNSDTSWYVVDYNGRQGWVANSVVSIQGPCDALPFVTPPPLPATATPTPTATPSAPTVDFRSTVQDGVTYPAGTCFTFYWTVTNIKEVYFDGNGVAGQGQQEVCPTESRNYVLRVVFDDDSYRDYAIPVGIEE
jgi:hypothetical protein